MEHSPSVGHQWLLVRKERRSAAHQTIFELYGLLLNKTKTLKSSRTAAMWLIVLNWFKHWILPRVPLRITSMFSHYNKSTPRSLILYDFFYWVISELTVQKHYTQPQLTPTQAFIKPKRDDVLLIGCSIIHCSRGFSWITEFQQCRWRGSEEGALGVGKGLLIFHEVVHECMSTPWAEQQPVAAHNEGN